MATRAPKYYRPYYPSDSEESDASESDLESDLESGSEDQGLPDFKALAQNLFRAAGPPLPTSEKEIDFSYNTVDRRTTYGPLVKGQEGYNLVTTVKQVDNVVVLQSLDRDKGIYPQPTNCQLMLPRTYQNVTKFEIADISFIASFFYFRDDKYNTFVSFRETDRVLYAPVLAPPPSSTPLPLLTRIREGSYNIDTVLQELATQFNTPPVFYDLINGYSDFYNAFITEGDYSANFNYPGDYYYDALRKVYIAQPTMAQIIAFYFQQRYALPTTNSINQTIFSDIQVKVAYYYPVLKELIMDVDSDPSHIKYQGASLTDNIITYILYKFTGLDDPIIRSILQTPANIPILDTYRLMHTFRYSPTNNYVCTYANQNTKVSIQATNLNTSLTNLLNTKYQTFLTRELQITGVTAEQYATATLQLAAYKSIISQMYNVIQTNLSHIFGVDFGTFADKYFITFGNVLLLKNGKYASNVAYDYNSGTNTLITSDISVPLNTKNTVYWPNMIILKPGATVITPSLTRYAYNPKLLTQDLDHLFQDSNGYIYVNPVERTTDLIVTVLPGTYTVIPIKSKIRQTVQVETIPRPSMYLYPEWNVAHADEIGNNQYEFTHGYSYALPDTPLAQSNISNYITPDLVDLGTVLTTDSITDVYTKQTSNLTTMTLSTTPHGTYFSFNTPDRLAEEDSNATIYKYQMAISFFPSSNAIPMISNAIPMLSNATITDAASNTFADDTLIFIYHDQAAFYADVGAVGRSNGESAFFYKYMAKIPEGSGVQTIHFTAYEAQTYYIYCRPVTPLQFQPITFTPVPFCTNSNPTVLSTNDTSFDPRVPGFNPYALVASNYIVAKVHDPDYIRLPIIDSNGYYYKTSIPSPLGMPGFLPSIPSPATSAINTLLQKPRVPLGYYSNVSDDLTDYIMISNTYPPRGFDPTNEYMFRTTPGASSYDSVSQTYGVGIISRSLSNAIVYPNGGAFSNQRFNTRREKKIVQYTGTHYIWTEFNAFTSANNLLPLNATTFPGLRSPFATQGPCGFLFMPEEGTWSIERLRFLSQTSNTNVHFLAIYPTAYVNEIELQFISLDKAICICVQTESKTYYDQPAFTGVPYGTYYTYTTVLRPNSNYVVSGTTQNTCNFITDTNAYYSAIAYSNVYILNNTNVTLNDFSNSTIVAIENLTGTCIPYPKLGRPIISSKFYDGTPSPDPQHDMLLSPALPLSNEDPNIDPIFLNFYTRQFAQSSPIVNSHLHYNISDFTIHGFFLYRDFLTVWRNIPDSPTKICSTIPGSMLFQTGEFPLVYYNTVSSNTDMTLKTTLTMDSIFPRSEDIILLAQSGNISQYIFLGCTDTSNLVFKAYDPQTGNLLVYPSISPSNAPLYNAQINSVQGLQVQGSQWWLCYLDGSNGMNIAYGSNFKDPYIQMASSFPGPYTAAYIQLDCESGTNLYFTASSNADRTFSSVYSMALTNLLPSVNILSSNVYIEYKLKYNTTSFCIEVFKGVEYIYLTTATKTYAYRMDTSTSIIVKSYQNYGRIPYQCCAGASNELWMLFDTYPYLLGHVYTPPSIQIAWQLMFPVMKVEMVELQERRLAIPDLTNLTTPEWCHTQLFAYSNSGFYYADQYFTYPSQAQWGQEAYYDMADTSFQGEYFNAYLQDVALHSNTTYIALRGFSPTESFQTEVRISLTNVYDYGYISINDLIGEIGSINRIPEQYSASYKAQLSTFDDAFIISGHPAVYGFSSFYAPTTGFSNFITLFSTLYAEYTTLASNVNAINDALTRSMNNFILIDLQYILPSNILPRTRFTDSLTFSFLWKSGLYNVPPDYANLTDAWGLGWNLGYVKEDDIQPATVHPASNMYKIIDDFLYLRLNPEFNLNRISAGTKENYLDSREPSGLTSYYYCKLLLNGYGQTATTFVHSPIVLNPPISRISKLAFQWLDSKGNLLNIDSATDSDWQMTVNIQENVTSTNFIEIPGSNTMTLTAVRE
jgi:hypothetical protein